MLHLNSSPLRRLLALTLMVLLLVSMVGCTKDKNPDSTNDPVSTESQNSATQAPETQAPATEAPTTEAPETTPNNPGNYGVFGIVTPEKLNIRKEADTDAEKAGYYVQGDRIEILEIKGAWGRTTHGWILLEYIQLDSGVLPEPGTTEEPDNAGPDADIDSDGNTKALGYGVISIGQLNVRTGPGTNHEAITTVSLGQRYAYFQKSGNWARTEKGWVSMSYFYVEGTTGENSGTGTISGSGVNIRVGPGTNFERVGAYEKDTKVTILTQINGWGYTSKGWVSMTYVAMEKQTAKSATVTADTLNIRKEPDTKAEKVGTYAKDTKITILETRDGWGRTDKGWVYLEYVKFDDAATEAPKTQTGTITATGLNIRKEPNINSESLGGYKQGDKVTILEAKDGWGRTDLGWIKLEYVKMDK